MGNQCSLQVPIIPSQHLPSNLQSMKKTTAPKALGQTPLEHKLERGQGGPLLMHMAHHLHQASFRAKPRDPLPSCESLQQN